MFVPAVLAFWEQSLRDERIGDEAHQHVALMRLAAAHETEAGNFDAIDQWRVSHQAWADLVRNDAFWDGLAAELDMGDAGVSAVADVRTSVPYWLLQAQLKLVRKRLFSQEYPRAIEQGRLIAGSPLVALTEGDQIRDELFLMLSGDLERHLHNRRFDEAMACIDRVIVADPENPRAQREMVRVAAAALEPSLAVLDSLTSRPDPTMVGETCGLLASLLATAERPIRDVAARDTDDAELARDLAVCLRSCAFVALHREGSPQEAGRLIDRAIELVDGVGGESSALRRLRSEIGLEVVERTMSRPTSREHAIAGEPDPVVEALSEVDRLLALDPKNAKVISQKARLLLVSHRDEEAERIARDLFASAREKAEPSAVRAAVELLHQVQSGRERFRYESQMEMVDRLIGQCNWRAALAMFKDATVGRENEPDHLLKHADILLGLHKVAKAEAVIEQLADCCELHDAWELRRARLDCLRHMFAAGGDLYSAFELAERGDHERARRIVRDMLEHDSHDPAVQFLAALIHFALGDTDRAQTHATAAAEGGRRAGLDWIGPILAAPEIGDEPS